jgi:type IV secretory pathway TraG/TraD family ATPase VirD4
MDPTDERCSSWKMAEDILDEDDADTLAEILVPINERASQPFFDDAARQILAAVVKALIRLKPGRWDLRDIVYCMRSMDRIKALLSGREEGRDLVKQYFSKLKTAQDVMSTIGTKVGRFNSVAKAWDKAAREGRSVSIEEWVRGNFIIVLGSSNKGSATVRDLNRLFFKRLSQVLLDEPDNDQGKLFDHSSRRHYLFLDEGRYAGRLDGLNELFLKGRSKGVSVIVTAQDLKGWQEVYGDKLADEQLSQAASIAILRLQNPDSAKWAASLIGQYECVQLSHSTNTGENGSGGSQSAAQVVKDAVLPSEILRLPPAGPKNGLPGYFLSADRGVWKGTLPWNEVMAERTPAGESSFPNFVKRTASLGELRPWDEKELFELGINPAKGSSEHSADEPDGKQLEEGTLEDFPEPGLDEETLQ